MSKISAEYVIVGGGSAGCVLANRLSADPAVRVVLVEAGGWDRDPFIAMPAGFIQLMRSGRYDWGYKTEPVPGLEGRSLFWPRGKVVGGSSSINGMIYVRGHPSDYDGWAQQGNRGWSYEECLPYFRKSERWVGGGNDVHGGDGELNTSRQPPVHPVARAFVAAAVEAGHPANPDMNSGDQRGFGPCDSTIGGARRSSAAAAFLHPVKNRKNLTVLTRTLATRVLLEKERAVGIECLSGGKPLRILADGEIILAGGTINSPQLLQLSGIGPADRLRRAGVEPLHDLPGVGENLQDHLVATVKQGTRGARMLSAEVAWWRAAMSLGRYALLRSGPAAHHGIQVLGFADSRPGLAAPDIQYHLLLLMYDNHGRSIDGAEGFMPYFNLSRPQSRGRIFVRSADPTAAPAIQPNYLQEGEDVRVMREGLKIARDIIARPAFDAYRSHEFAPGADIAGDAEIDRYVRRTAESVYHPVGTCKMGSDSFSVVDDRLRVRGIDRLRVIDASIMPTISSGNTNAPTIMIAERGASFVLERHEGRRSGAGPTRRDDRQSGVRTSD